MRRPVGALLALSGLAALALLVWAAVIQPIRTWQAEALAGRDAAVREMARLGDRIAALTAERAGLSEGGTLDIVWNAQQMGQATARIQSALSGLASERGIALRSVAPSGTRDLSLAMAAGFRLEFEAMLDQLTGFLTDIEYHSPVLVVERATLRRLNRPQTAAAGGGLQQPLVFVQLDVLAPVLLTEGG